jgi:Transmembrane secretion effector
MTIGKARGRGLHIDLRPFGTSRDFRFLFASRTITLAGSQATEVALLVQARQLTGSPIDVGLLGAAELVPLVLFGLYGGMLADRLDRRLLARWPEAGLGGIAVLLVVNAALPRPSAWPLYALAAATMALAALQRPSLDASVPRIVPRELLAAARAGGSAGRPAVRARTPGADRLVPGRPGGDDVRLPGLAVPVPGGAAARPVGGGADVLRELGGGHGRVRGQRLGGPGAPARPGHRGGRGRLGRRDRGVRAGPRNRPRAGLPGGGGSRRHAQRCVPGHAVEPDHPGRAARPAGRRGGTELRPRPVSGSAAGRSDGGHQHPEGLALVGRPAVRGGGGGDLRGAARVPALPGRGRGPGWPRRPRSARSSC